MIGVKNGKLTSVCIVQEKKSYAESPLSICPYPNFSSLLKLPTTFVYNSITLDPSEEREVLYPVMDYLEQHPQLLQPTSEHDCKKS